LLFSAIVVASCQALLSPQARAHEVGAEVYYVDAAASGSGVGSSWENAFPKLQDALRVSGAGDEIRIAVGVYVPDDQGELDATFQVPSGVTLRGGYVGATRTRFMHEQGIGPVKTVLSGDLFGNDDGTASGISDNARTVLTVASAEKQVVLQSLTITGGQGVAPMRSAPRAGGVHVEASSVLLRDVYLEGNQSAAGSAITCGQGADVTLVNCVLADNQSTSTGLAGALYASGDAKVVIRSSRWQGNKALGSGAAFVAAGNSDLRIEGSLILGNFADEAGAGIVTESAKVSIVSCRIIGNRAYQHGALVFSTDELVEVTGTEILGNVAILVGTSAMRCMSHCIIRSSTIAGNVMDGPVSAGAAAVSVEGVVVKFNNSIVWGNTATILASVPQVLLGLGAIQACYSDVGGLETTYCGETSFDLDPGFAGIGGPDGIIGTIDDTSALSGDSPCIDVGDPIGAGSVDVSGTPRLLDGDLDGTSIVDIGAREFGHASVAVVEQDSPHIESIELLIGVTPGMDGTLLIGMQRGLVPLPPYGLLMIEPDAGFSRMGLGVSTGYFRVSMQPVRGLEGSLFVQALATDASKATGTLSNVVRVELP
jgi:hypothetical protein